MGPGASRRPGSLYALDRRRFLMLASACAVAPAVHSAAQVISAVQAPEPPLVQNRMSVGFVEGSDELPSLHGISWAGGGFEALSEQVGDLRVVPADELPLGDQTLAGETVRVRLAGLYPQQPKNIAPFLRQARLTVMFPSDDPTREQPLPFEAWSYRGKPAPMVSPRACSVWMASEIDSRRGRPAAASRPRRRLMRTIAHISDLHIGPLPPVTPRNLLSKRLLGYLSWRSRKQRIHRIEVLAALERRMLRRTRVLSVMSRYLAGVLREVSAPESDVFVVAAGVDDDLFRVDRAEADYILYYGRFDIFQKGLDTLVVAAREVLGRHPAVRLVLAGRGRDEGRLRALVRDAGLGERAVVETDIDPPRRARLFSGALVLAMPSRFEGFGMVAAEAMAAGVPVVATDLDSLPEVVGDAGILVPRDDAPATPNHGGPHCSHEDFSERPLLVVFLEIFFVKPGSLHDAGSRRLFLFDESVHALGVFVLQFFGVEMLVVQLLDRS